MQIVFQPRFSLNEIPDLDHRSASLRKKGFDDDFIATELAAARDVLASWRAILQLDITEETADFEDFFENAIQLVATIEYVSSEDPAGDIYRVYLTGREFGDGLDATRQIHGAQAPFDPALPFIFLGSPGLFQNIKHEPGICWPRYDLEPALQQSHELPSFPILAGRLCQAATFAPDEAEDGPDLFASAVAMARQLKAAGKLPKILIKVVGKSKYAAPEIFVARIDAAGEVDAKALAAEIRDRFDMTLIHFEGRRHAFLVQEWVEMRHEYRTIMVNGEILTGAGCVEAATPLVNAGDAFDDLVEEGRNCGNARRIPGFGQRALSRAREIARTLQAEDPRCLHATIDLYENTAGELHLVEANPFVFIGFYAADFRRLLPAIIAYAKLAGPAPVMRPRIVSQPTKLDDCSDHSTELALPTAADTFDPAQLLADLKLRISLDPAASLVEDREERS